MKRIQKIGLLSLMLLLIAVPAAAQDEVPRFEPGDCVFEPSPNVNVECGFVNVPEDRSNPDSPMIRLAIAHFRADADTQTDDVLLNLDGGPGGTSLEFAGLLHQLFSATFAAGRDIVFFDQRGVGNSEPALNCPEFTDWVVESLAGDVTVEEDRAGYAAAAADCFDRLSAEGIALAAYTSAENAADVNDIRRALGYDTVTLYGISYGARLALTVVRDFPEIVRAAVISGVYPPQANLTTETPANTDRILDLLFADCAADPACNAAYPDLESVFFDLVAQLNTEPAPITINNAFTGGQTEMALNGDEFVLGTFFALYYTQLIPEIPARIYAARAGDFAALIPLIETYVATEAAVSRGMYLAVTCNEEFAFSDQAEFETGLTLVPELQSYFLRSGDFGLVCADWPATSDPVENEPVASDVPVLLLAGAYDPITPPRWAALAAETLSNGYLYTFPGFSHDAALAGLCPLTMTAAFIADPTTAPDASCIADLGAPAFTVPE
ncbi:MAG: alpha/beta hydrolase [Chloroflexi bacterium]|nr:alpha/beta hydrolase [Chloroflexota bacterium]